MNTDGHIHHSEGHGALMVVRVSTLRFSQEVERDERRLQREIERAGRSRAAGRGRRRSGPRTRRLGRRTIARSR